MCIKNKQVDLAMQTLLNFIMFDPNLSNWGRDATINKDVREYTICAYTAILNICQRDSSWKTSLQASSEMRDSWRDVHQGTRMKWHPPNHPNEPQKYMWDIHSNKETRFWMKKHHPPPQKKTPGILNHSPKPPQTSPEPALRCTGVAGSPIRHPAGYQHPSNDRWNCWWKQGNSWEWWDEICEVKIENDTHRDFTSLTIISKEYKWIQKSHSSNIKRPENDSKYVSIPV